MRTLMSSIVACGLLLIGSTAAFAQYPSYSYNVYPGGASYSYTLSNGYETVSITERISYGTYHASYSYRGPYGNYSWDRTYTVPTYYPTYYSGYYPQYRYPIRR